MKIDNVFTSNNVECIDYKMNTSNSDSEQNNSTNYSDSGYLTNFQESQSLSTNSSAVSSEDLYPHKISMSAIKGQNLYFCENAVFDEPKLEGPPILSEEILDLNKYMAPAGAHSHTSSSLTVIEDSSSNLKYESLHFENLQRSISNLAAGADKLADPAVATASHSPYSSPEFLPPKPKVKKYTVKVSDNKNVLRFSRIITPVKNTEDHLSPIEENLYPELVDNHLKSIENVDIKGKIDMKENMFVVEQPEVNIFGEGKFSHANVSLKTPPDFPSLSESLPGKSQLSLQNININFCSEQKEIPNLFQFKSSPNKIQHCDISPQTPPGLISTPQPPTLAISELADPPAANSLCDAKSDKTSSDCKVVNEVYESTPEKGQAAAGLGPSSAAQVLSEGLQPGPTAQAQLIYMDTLDTKVVMNSAPSNCSKQVTKKLVFSDCEFSDKSANQNLIFKSNNYEFHNENILKDISNIDRKTKYDLFVTKNNHKNAKNSLNSLSDVSVKVEQDENELRKHSSVSIPKATTPNKPILNAANLSLSPELFSEEEAEAEEEAAVASTGAVLVVAGRRPLSETLLRNDRRLLRRVQEAVSGVPPPPSVTIMQITVADMLDKIHQNKQYFLTDIFGDGTHVDKTNEDEKKNVKSLLICHKEEEVLGKEWPDIMDYRYHGLHYNRTKVSEDFEMYCSKYLSRFVGCETASSCTVWSGGGGGGASAKKRLARRWGVKSPGRRLSHLAKRRITFSSSNLQASCSAASLSVLGLNSHPAKQLVIDARKPSASLKRKSPWHKSPRKSPHKRIKTPNGGSAKKASGRRLLAAADVEAGPSRPLSTKRALFQSPEHTLARSTTSSSSTAAAAVARSLFLSPRKNSPMKSLKNSPLKLRNSPLKIRNSPIKVGKRKRVDEECHPNKFPRSLSFEPQSSGSSGGGAGGGGTQLTRSHSELSVGRGAGAVRPELSELHKKKLLWAVSEALRSQQIGMSHPKFRTFAPVLCKVVKHLMPELYGGAPRQGSTSDRMLRIARQHVFAVTRGKTYEEVIQEARHSLQSLRNSKQPTGYVPLSKDEAEESNNQANRDMLNSSRSSVEGEEREREPDVLRNRLGCVLPESKSRGGRQLGAALRELPGNTEAAHGPRTAPRDENGRLRIKRQIMFDEEDDTRRLNAHR